MESYDGYFMRLALAAAREALNKGEVPVGAIIVSDGGVVGAADGRSAAAALVDVRSDHVLQGIVAGSYVICARRQAAPTRSFDTIA